MGFFHQKWTVVPASGGAVGNYRPRWTERSRREIIEPTPKGEHQRARRGWVDGRKYPSPGAGVLVTRILRDGLRKRRHNPGLCAHHEGPPRESPRGLPYRAAPAQEAAHFTCSRAGDALFASRRLSIHKTRAITRPIPVCHTSIKAKSEFGRAANRFAFRGSRCIKTK
jgi:hypothetical protein